MKNTIRTIRQNTSNTKSHKNTISSSAKINTKTKSEIFDMVVTLSLLVTIIIAKPHSSLSRKGDYSLLLQTKFKPGSLTTKGLTMELSQWLGFVMTMV